jgi:arylsulfatase
MESGLTNLHHPNMLHEDNHAIPTDSYPDGYYFTDDITDRAIEMIRGVKASDPATPFFLYCAHGAVHAPLMAKQVDIEKYRGRYELGWDMIREERFGRQLDMGVIPAWTQLPPRNSEPDYASPAWESLPDKEKRLFARYMEVYAAMVDNIDQNLGRLRDALEELGQLDNTIIVFTSDNGGSREGGGKGTTQYFKTVGMVHSHMGNPENVDLDYERLDLIGGPRLMVHYPWGWGMASNTPLRLHKGTTFAGGHRVPLIVSWPAGIAGRNEIRFQYTHLSDVLPTLTEMIGLETPAERNGMSARAMTGSSFGEVLAAGDTPSAHPEQYYEMSGHRGYYREGWEAVTIHYPNARFDDEQWHLFNVEQDPAQTTDLAADEPERVEELTKAWDQAAWTYLVYPIDDGMGMMRLTDPTSMGGAGEKVVTLLPGTPTLERGVAAGLIHGRSFSVTVSLEHHQGDRGILFAHGDQGGGYCVYVDDDGSCVFAHNAYGAMTVVSGGVLPDGTTQVTLDITADAGARWTARLAADSKHLAAASDLEALGFLAPFEGIDVGMDRRSPVSWELYERHSTFPYTGRIHQVVYRATEFAPDAPQRIAAERNLAETKFQ